ncbi:cytochrome c biogenesis protein CcdA [Patescibacteria group bacterium]|nr:cytochrome c biogenesis protein CcdA [Patescibacteria group bacterium]
MQEHVDKVMGTEGGDQTPPDDSDKKVRVRIATVGFVLFLIFVIGILWFISNPEMGAGLTLSFIAGLTMIFLPCTLPMAFVIVPMTMGKAPLKGFLMALAFGLGLSITLSFYGIFIAYIGQFLGLTAATQIMLMIGGGASLLFGLSEIRLIKFRLPSYTGKFPDFIQKRGDYIKVFLLGLFLGNAGVGCPNPAFYVLMGYIATVGDLFNGWFLGFIHGVGRAVPLIFLAILGILGINATSKVAGKQDAIERYMGWVLIFIGSFILTFGLFGHDWFISSGVHTSWEKLVVSVAGEQFGENILQHAHKLVNIEGFIQWGNMFFLALIGIIIALFAKFKKPSRKFLRGLLILYALLVLSIGAITGWTFKLSPDATGHGSITPHEETAEHTDPPGTPSDHGHIDESVSVDVGPGFMEASFITEGLSVDLTLSSTEVTAGEEVELSFFVNTKPEGRPVTDLEIEHEKYIHVLGVRDDLTQFFHIHPTDDGDGVWSTDYVFEKAGTYKIWSDVKVGGATQTFGHTEVIVSGDDVIEDSIESGDKFTRSITLGRVELRLDLHDGVSSLIETQIDFVMRDVFGADVELEPYLGADMHLAIIKDDLSVFIHTHPSEHDADGDEHMNVGHIDADDHGEGSAAEKELSFVTAFPTGGVYKMFAQFRPAEAQLGEGEAIVAEFYINVEGEESVASSAPADADADADADDELVVASDGHTDHFHEPAVRGKWYESQKWWVLLLGSLVLMTLLSLYVRKYLQVKE